MKYRWHGVVSLVFVMMLVFAACGSEDPSLSDDPVGDSASGQDLNEEPTLDGSWVLVAASVDGEILALSDEYRVTMTIDGSEIGGRAACNGYGGAVSIDDGSFSVTNIAQNEMACEPAIMQIESAFLKGLLRVTDAVRSGDTAALGGEGVEFGFELLPPVPTSDLIGVTWVLDTIIQGEAVSSAVATAQPATLLLSADGSFTGGTGCRELSGEYIVSGDVVHFTSFGAEGECPGELQRQDGQVVTVLGDGFTAHLDGDRLTVSSAGGEGLSYTSEQ